MASRGSVSVPQIHWLQGDRVPTIAWIGFNNFTRLPPKPRSA
jgi:hypothetical protein